MIAFIKSLYLNIRFYYSIGFITLLFFLSYFFDFLYYIAQLALGILIFLTFTDLALLYLKKGISADRFVPDKLSNGDKNPIQIAIQNHYTFDIETEIIDEIPIEFQIRDFKKTLSIPSEEKKTLTYYLRPTQRGLYSFGNINIFVFTKKLGFVMRRFNIETPLNQEIPCYPSFIQLKKYDLIAFSQTLTESGLKKLRRVGNSSEFDQIKDYVKGDDIRHINWKATAKRNQLMVNQYVEEKSQSVYSIIDTGRSMKMPFNGMTLLDYAINTSLVISNVALKKEDKAGLATFSTSLSDLIVADRRNNQMHLIQQALYNINTHFKETDFGRLYVYLKHKITHRSLLFLYTNFETLDSLKRQLKYLRAINKNHLLVVILFKNSELDQLTQKKSKHIHDVYDKTLAEKFIYEKKLIEKELNKNGILTILTNPNYLIINTINQYLEIKSKNLL
ncbi:hypothetical protein UJ101_02306 [Flavobacteriaceae bacterium UJ101]|nr:hypothetical protein UJ101_02306 [Flavobacteriaceae bacterium UJ101]